jgi:predicted DCC family thiol-disulfide oxidoreductase YuxK
VKLTVYYDGLCRVCSWEVRHYYEARGVADRVEIVDYTSPDFDAAAEGLDRAALDRYLHVRRPDGRVCVGVEAFIALWEVVPGFGWLARLAGSPVLNPLFRAAYAGFVRVRPYLPRRRRAACSLPRRV